MKRRNSLLVRVLTIALLTSIHPLFAADSWSPLNEGAQTGLNNPVRGLVMLGGELYAGGDFNASGFFPNTETMVHVAKWDGTGWSEVGTSPPSSGVVYRLATANGYLYAGGTFTTAGGGAANKIAKWDPINNTWTPLGTTGNEGVNGNVHAVATRGDRVYAGGEFTTAAGGSVNLTPDYVGYFDTTWHSLSGSGGPTAQINALAIADNGDVYVGGNGNFFKRWTGTDGSGTWTALGTVTGGDVSALAIRGNKVWVGGTFTTAGGTSVNRIAVWNITSAGWEYLTTPPWNTDSGNVVTNIAFNGSGQAYVVGKLPGTSASHVHVYGTTGWLSGVPNGSPNAVCHAVAMDRYGGKVYVGGEFTTIGGPTSYYYYVAAWNDFENITVTDLGALYPGQYSSYGSGLNQNGEATGNAVGLYSGNYLNHAFRWVNGTMSDLGSLATGKESFGYAINDGSVVVGKGLDLYNNERAFRWTSGGGITTLPTISGWTYGGMRYQAATALNNDGVMVGYALNSSGVYRAVRWDDPVTEFTDLESLAGQSAGNTSYAYGINSAGYTVGSSITSSGQTHAFLTDPNQTIASADDLGTFTGGTSSVAYAINDFGEVVGRARRSDGLYRAFVTASFSTISDSGDLGTLGGNYSAAYAINNVGQVAGISTSSSSVYHAFLYQSGLGMVDLNNVIAPGSGWVLTGAEAINDRGKVVGWGTLNGITRAFLLDPTK